MSRRTTSLGFTVIEALIVAAIVLTLAALIVGAVTNRSNFEAACAKRGGETVYDGRQYQCMTNAKEGH